MPANELGVGILLSVKDMATDPIKRVDAGLSGLEKRTSKVDASFAGIASGLAAAALPLMAFNRAIDASARFGKTIALITTVATDARHTTAALKDEALKLAAAYGSSAFENADAIYQAISAGVTDATKVSALMAEANKLAVGDMTDVKTAVDGLTGALNNYGAKGLTAKDASDSMFLAVKLGKTRISELSVAMGRVAPLAAAMGLGFDELTGSLAAATTKNISTAEATSGLKAAMANIMKPTADAAKEAKRLGVDFSAAALRTKGWSGFLQSLTGSAKFNADSLGQLFGSIEAVNTMTALTADNSKAYNDVMTAMASKAGTTDDAFKKVAGTFGFQRDRFKAMSEAALIMVGDALEPAAAAITKVGNAILETFMGIPAPARNFIVQVTAAAAGVVAFGGALKVLRLVFPLVSGSIFGAVKALNPLLLLTSPLALGIGAIAAALVGLSVATGKTGDFSKSVQAAFQKVKLGAMALGQLFSGGVISGPVLEELKRAENSGVKAFAINVYVWAGRIGRFFSGIADGFAASVERARPVFDAFSDALDRIGDAFSGLSRVDPAEKSRRAWQAWGEAGATTGDVLGSVVTYVTAGLTTLLRFATGVFQGLSDGWADQQDAITGVRQAFGVLWESLKELFGITGQATGSMKGLGDGAESTGHIVGGMLAEALGLAARLVQVLALAATGLVKVFGAVRDVFVAVGDAIGEGLAETFLFFAEEVPNTLEIAGARISNFFRRVADGVAEMVETAQLKMSQLVDSDEDFAAKQEDILKTRLTRDRDARKRDAEFTRLLERANREGTTGMANRNVVVGTTRRGNVLGSREAANEPGARIMGPAGREVAVASPRPALAITGGQQPRPAVAVATAAAEQAAAGPKGDGGITPAVRDLKDATAKLVEAQRERVTVVSINIDGEKVGEAVAKGERNRKALSFQPMPAGT